MCDEIDTLQPEAVEDAAQLFGAFDQPNRPGTCFPPAVEDDTPGLAKCAHLASIHKFQVFEYWHEDQGRTLADVNQREINLAYRCATPERLNKFDICVKCACINVSMPGGTHYHL